MKKTLLTFAAAAIAATGAVAQDSPFRDYNFGATMIADSDGKSTIGVGGFVALDVTDSSWVKLDYERTGAHDKINQTQTFGAHLYSDVSDSLTTGVFYELITRDRDIADDSFSTFGVEAQSDTGVAQFTGSVGFTVRSVNNADDDFISYNVGAGVPMSGDMSVRIGLSGLMNLGSNDNISTVNAGVSLPILNSGANLNASYAHEITGRTNDQGTYSVTISYATDFLSSRSPRVTDFNW